MMGFHFLLFRVDVEGTVNALPIVQNDRKPGNESKHPNSTKETEVRKAIIPLDERMTMFTNLLKEKEVRLKPVGNIIYSPLSIM